MRAWVSPTTLLLLLLAFSSCVPLPQTTRREIPYKVVKLLKAVRGGFPTDGVVEVPTPHFDMREDGKEFLRNPYQIVDATTTITLPVHFKNLQVDFCFEYSYSFKTGALGETIEVPMADCDKGVIWRRASFVGMTIFIKDYLYELYDKWIGW